MYRIFCNPKLFVDAFYSCSTEVLFPSELKMLNILCIMHDIYYKIYIILLALNRG